MKNFLITQGCTGTYSIIDVLGKKFNTPQINHHTRDSNSSIFLENSKVIYILCNPYDYTISSFERSKEGPFNISHTKQCGGDWQYFERNKNQTLEEYLIDPYDAFKYREHGEGYLNNSKRRYNLLFMRYEALSIFGIKPLVDFWGLGDSSQFSYEFKNRKSDWTQMPENVQILFDRKYGDVMRWYQSLPLIKKYEVERK